MGCDIHLVVQVKEPGSIHWFTQGKFKADRWYTMFAYMNRTVRNYDEVLGYDEKGIPEDCYYKPESEETARDLGDHSYSWLTSDEFREAAKRAYKDEKVGNIVSYDAILRYMMYFESKGYQTRLIFGFDS